VDSTGIKVSNRGEWIRKVWKVKRGFIKVHIAEDTKTMQILAIEVTKENVGDGKMLGRLVESSGRRGNVRRGLLTVRTIPKTIFGCWLQTILRR
jgi:hypothetical protein